MPVPDRIPLADVRKIIGRKVHINSLLRWVKVGARGTKLKAEFIAGRWYTTAAWVQEFVAAGTTKAFQRASAGPEETLISAVNENNQALERMKQRWGIDPAAEPKPIRRRRRNEPDEPTE